ncbi:hypothetical protein V498_09978, partial [Pseudogymnoascus sp. VKM F-4517 (FW-2822)]
MAPPTPTLVDRQSQITDVDSEWLTEDCSTTGSPDSEFDELFSQNTMHIAASGGSHWRNRGGNGDANAACSTSIAHADSRSH